MPQNFRKLFKAGKLVAHVRRKANQVFEIRLQLNGTRITASGKELSVAKARFLEKLMEFKNMGEKRITPNITLGEYMRKWLETVRKPTVKEVTYDGYYRTFTNYICPSFGKRSLSSINSFELQDLINRYSAFEKNRTAKKIYQLLASMFTYAVSDGLLPRSPMEKVILQRYEVENGAALTREEERALVAGLKQKPAVYRQAYVFLLYTGLRRSEVSSVSLENGWITLISAKQRKGFKEKTRCVPISPMLARLLPLIDIDRIRGLSVNKLTQNFKKVLPNHHLHDLRHTFITRAQECGIQRELVSLWAGHAADSSITSAVYTHLGQNKEHQKEEMKKFDYDLQ